MEQPGYSEDACHFCGGNEAGFQRREENDPKGPFYDCCQDCLIKETK